MTQPYPNQLQNQFENPPGRTRPPLRADFFRLARVLQALLGVTVVLHVGLIVADLYYLELAQRLIDTPRRVPFEDLERYDSVAMITGLSQVGLFLLTGVVFISWLFKAHRSDRVDPDRLEHKSFWAIIGWFVPIMNLFRPTQMINDTRRGADPFAVTPVAQPYWWAAYLIGGFGDRVITALWPTGDEPGLRSFGEQLQDAAWAELTFGVVNIVAAVLAILVVRDLTATLRDAPQGLRFG